MVGYIYIFTNPGFKEYVKIGYADDWKDRLKALSNKSSVPYAFRCYAIYKTSVKLGDKVLHKLIDQMNPALRVLDNVDGKERKREFYEMTPEQAYSILDAIAKITNTEKNLIKIKPSKEDIAEENRAREVQRPPFKFSMINMKENDIVYFKENKKIKAVVVDDSHVKYGQVTYTLSSLAQEIKETDYPLQGPVWFTDKKGRTLDELRTLKGK